MAPREGFDPSPVRVTGVRGRCLLTRASAASVGFWFFSPRRKERPYFIEIEKRSGIRWVPIQPRCVPPPGSPRLLARPTHPSYHTEDSALAGAGRGLSGRPLHSFGARSSSIPYRGFRACGRGQGAFRLPPALLRGPLTINLIPGVLRLQAREFVTVPQSSSMRRARCAPLAYGVVTPLGRSRRAVRPSW